MFSSARRACPERGAWLLNLPVMSSVLHPVGPEPRERYWVRRLAVLVAIVVAIGIVIALVGNAMSAGSAVQAEPVPPTIAPPVVTASPTPTVAASDSASPAASGTPSVTPGTTPGATPSASPTPSSSSTASAKKSATTKAPTTSTKKSKKSKKTKKTTQPVYGTCDGSDLRPTLTGDRTVKVGKKTTFSLSVINGGKKTCKVTVKPSSATLTIVSGGDRIWSTKDCPAAVPAAKRTLLPEHALGWKVTWSGKRSADGCKTSKIEPKKGYYWAIANFDGADDVRFRVILT
jgi:hypothetical protein